MRFWKAQDNDINEGLTKAWLFRVCRNLSIDYLRKNKRFVELGDKEIESPDTVETAAATETEGELEGILSMVSELPKQQKEVVRLKYQHDMSYKEIAEILEIPVNQVGVVLHKAIRRIKTQLEKQQTLKAAG